VIAREAAETQSKDRLMPARILLADADRRLTEIYREHLEDLGLAVQTAADGVQCVNLLREFRPNLLMLGTSLPWGGCDGVLAFIKEEPDLRPEFVLLLAERSDRHVLYRVAPCHIDDFHFKPLSPSRLEQYLKDLLVECSDLACLGCVRPSPIY
jgi:DNA-binding response OmpR family regulator